MTLNAIEHSFPAVEFHKWCSCCYILHIERRWVT